MITAASTTYLENIQNGAINTLVGMGTVFIILIFISFLISSLKYLPMIVEKLSKKSVVNEIKPKPIIQEEIVEVIDSELDDELEIAAVIAAAIAADSEYNNTQNTLNNGLIVRSLKRR